MSIIESDYRLRFSQEEHIMCDAKHEIQRVEMARWIASYISPIGDGTPWIEGHGVIKVETLTFVAKFSWLLNRYRLCPTIVDILLT